jgi:hypothetical protein
MIDFVQPQIDLELDEGEIVLHTSRRHWVVLLMRGFIPLLIGGLAALLAFFRAIGGRFIESGVAEGRIDFSNIVFLALIVGLAILWQRRPRPKKPPLGLMFLYDLPYVVGMGVLALLIYFRLQGGRLFHVDPVYARGGDVLNLTLIVLVVAMFGLLIYMTIDWANDFLILTNTRVIYDDQQLLVRHVQQQMMLDDIQQVNARAEKYREYWLGYGTLTVRSFSPRRLVFEHCNRPQIMQSKILGELNKLRRQQEPQLLRRMIEDQVYGNKPPPAPSPAIHVRERGGPIPWVFHPNPHIDHKTETIVWRPFWLFLVIAVLRPVGTFLLATVALVILNRLGMLPGVWAFVLWLPILLACGFWTFWIYEEHENDMYILTRNDISDVDKKPFGPESRRRAPLSAIQDISYDVGFLENLLGYGDINIQTGGAGGGQFTFHHVPDPRGVQATINDYLTDFRKREKEGQMQNTLDILKQYHAAQLAHQELLDRERLAVVAAEVSQSVTANVSDRVAQEIASQLPHHLRREVYETARQGSWRKFRRRWRR